MVTSFFQAKFIGSCEGRSQRLRIFKGVFTICLELLFWPCEGTEMTGVTVIRVIFLPG